MKRVFTYVRKVRGLLPSAMSRIGLLFILLLSIMSVAGYLITPDQTPYCNQQYLELGTLKPLSKTTYIYVCNQEATEQVSWFRKMLSGQPLNYTAIPIYKYEYNGEYVDVETFTGSQPNDGEKIRIERSSVVDIASRTHWLGTDGYGRDVLSQIMIGSRVSLSVGLIAVAIALLIGVSLGAIAGYYGGKIDAIIVWFTNVIWSIPTILLVIAITFVLGKGFWQVFVAVGLTMWVDIARMVRGEVLSIKEKEFVEASRALGYSTRRIIFRHILPNIIAPIIVVSSSNFATAILLESGLSFLGIGVQPPMPSWGSMVKENYHYILLDNAYLAIVPGLAIMLTVSAFMLVGHGLNSRLNIKKQ